MSDKIKAFLDRIDTIPLPARYVLGVLCLVLGIAGLVLPFLQGILLIVTAVVLFGFIGPAEVDRVSENIRRWKDELTKK